MSNKPARFETPPAAEVSKKASTQIQDLEFITECSETLWDETSHQGLLKRFATILSEKFQVEILSLYGVFERDKGFSRPIPLDLPCERHEVPKEIEEALSQSLATLVQTGEVITKGIIQKKLAGNTYCLAILESTKPKFFVMVWVPPDGMTAQLDYLVRQLQSEGRWLNKLDQAEAMLYKDDLTGLFNYRYLDLALESEIRRAERFKTCFCLMFIDLDNFKAVNDQYGHLVGSQVLREIGDVLKEQIREVDSIIRYGGDEYIIILLGASTETGAIVAERIRHRIEHYHFQAGPIKVTASIGVSSYPEHGTTKDSLLRCADENMYEGKRQGKNQVIVFGKDQQNSPEPIH